MSSPKPQWRVANGSFIGKVLVRNVVKGTSPTRYEDGWLPFAHDLRSIDSIKTDGNDQPEQTALYHGGTFVGTVNAPFEELLPHWLAVRHAFDRVPVTIESVPVPINISRDGYPPCTDD